MRFALTLLDHVKTTRLSREVGVVINGCGLKSICQAHLHGARHIRVRIPSNIHDTHVTISPPPPPPPTSFSPPLSLLLPLLLPLSNGGRQRRRLRRTGTEWPRTKRNCNTSRDKRSLLSPSLCLPLSLHANCVQSLLFSYIHHLTPPVQHLY